jgi:hypothetical protein
MAYNATAYKKREDGSVFSVEAVEIDDDGRVLRACGLWSPFNGTDRYEAIWESAQFPEVADIHIEKDGAEGYRKHLSRLIG